MTTPNLPPPGPAAPTQHAPGGRGWAYTGTVLGAVSSVAANIADAYVAPKSWHPTHSGQAWSPDLGAVLGSVFWPLALLVASETLARKRWAGPRSRAVGVAAVLLVALVAAVISYQHLHGLLQHYQETDLSAALGPLAVDGLMIVCSLALVSADAPTVRLEATGTNSASATGPATGSSPAADASPAPEAGRTSAPRSASRPRTGSPAATTGMGTAGKVMRLKAKHPDMTSAEIARRLGVTDRTVRRYLAPPTTDPTGSHPTGGTPTTTATTTQITTEASADDARAA